MTDPRIEELQASPFGPALFEGGSCILCQYQTSENTISPTIPWYLCLDDCPFNDAFFTLQTAGRDT